MGNYSKVIFTCVFVCMHVSTAIVSNKGYNYIKRYHVPCYIPNRKSKRVWSCTCMDCSVLAACTQHMCTWALMATITKEFGDCLLNPIESNGYFGYITLHFTDLYKTLYPGQAITSKK